MLSGEQPKTPLERGERFVLTPKLAARAVTNRERLDQRLLANFPRTVPLRSAVRASQAL